MGYNAAILRRAQQRLDEAQSQALRDSEQRAEDIYSAHPRLREIERELRKTSARVFAAAYRAGGDPAAAVEQLKEENLALQHEREWILDSEDIDPEDLVAEPVCKSCGGTGWQGAVMCDCLRELCRQEQKKELARQFGRENFDRFRLDVYPEEYNDDLGASPRQLMQKTYERAVRYVQTFTPEAKPILLAGATGLGKTFLSGCMAKAVADKGFSVEYVTAETLFSDFEEEKFRPRPEEDRTQAYFDTDLLIIDDLGTEMTTQMTVAALYRVVNTRLMGQKATMISTNLPLDELEARYSAQIASRLLGRYTIFKFYGDDIRMKQ